MALCKHPKYLLHSGVSINLSCIYIYIYIYSTTLDFKYHLHFYSLALRRVESWTKWPIFFKEANAWKRLHFDTNCTEVYSFWSDWYQVRTGSCQGSRFTDAGTQAYWINQFLGCSRWSYCSHNEAGATSLQKTIAKSWSHEIHSYNDRIALNLTDISAALLPRCLSNFRAIEKV